MISIEGEKYKRERKERKNDLRTNSISSCIPLKDCTEATFVKKKQRRNEWTKINVLET